MDKLATCFVEALGIDRAWVTPELAYGSIPQWDSVGHMAVVAAIEEAFQVVLDADDVVGMTSLAKAREILRKHGIDATAR